MKVKKSTALICSVLLTTACSQSVVEGHVYIVVGGNAKPSRGETVSLIPIGNRADLLYSASKAAFESATAPVRDRIELACQEASEFIAHTQPSIEDELRRFQQQSSVTDLGCYVLEMETERLNRESEELDEVHSTRQPHHDTQAAARSCTDNNWTLQTLTDRLASLEEAAIELTACTEGNSDARSAISTLKSLNAYFGEDFEVPDFEGEYFDEAIENVLTAITSNRVERTDSTIDGAFAFHGIGRGNYLLFSEYADSFIQGFWLTPVAVDGTSRIDLNHRNFVATPFPYYLAHQFLTACAGCTEWEFKNSMASESDIVAAYRE